MTAIRWPRCGHTAYQVHDSLRLIPGRFVRCTRRALHLGEHHWPEVHSASDKGAMQSSHPTAPSLGGCLATRLGSGDPMCDVCGGRGYVGPFSATHGAPCPTCNGSSDE